MSTATPTDILNQATAAFNAAIGAAAPAAAQAMQAVAAQPAAQQAVHDMGAQAGAGAAQGATSVGISTAAIAGIAVGTGLVLMLIGYAALRNDSKKTYPFYKDMNPTRETRLP